MYQTSPQGALLQPVGVPLEVSKAGQHGSSGAAVGAVFKTIKEGGERRKWRRSAAEGWRDRTIITQSKEKSWISQKSKRKYDDTWVEMLEETK